MSCKLINYTKIRASIYTELGRQQHSLLTLKNDLYLILFFFIKPDQTMVFQIRGETKIEKFIKSPMQFQKLEHFYTTILYF